MKNNLFEYQIMFSLRYEVHVSVLTVLPCLTINVVLFSGDYTFLYACIWSSITGLNVICSWKIEVLFVYIQTFYSHL